jgi:hypothetical protein
VRRASGNRALATEAAALIGTHVLEDDWSATSTDGLVARACQTAVTGVIFARRLTTAAEGVASAPANRRYTP